ncbi:MAG: hypothetical protein U0L42_03005 [Methanobrevibacter sp.]|uniref:hypothetical protein n=1 Tax=Methanobrevibacter sp. TaxID=66852 RepID=UPI002E79414D|nr:hypothetical protein [Methanobrevibacter sp.]MEE0934619.1 hypothetical protein [Methanobrevibacter sp.]
MFFNTIEEYDIKLNDIKSTLDSMEKRLDEEPYSDIRKSNYEGLMHVYRIILKDRDDFLEMMDENINLHIYGENVKNHKISLSVMKGLFDNFCDLTSFMSDYLKANLNFTFESHELKLEQVSKGSIQILFSMDENITDLNEVYLNSQVFNRLLDLVECKKEDLAKQKEIVGINTILAYKKFLSVIIENELDFTLESNSRKVGLSHNEALEIYKEIDGS